MLNTPFVNCDIEKVDGNTKLKVLDNETAWTPDCISSPNMNEKRN